MRQAREDEGPGRNGDDDATSPGHGSEYATPGTETPNSIPEIVPMTTVRTNCSREGRMERRTSWSSTHSQNWIGTDRSDVEREWPTRSWENMRRRSSHATRSSDLNRRLSRSWSQNTNGLGIDAIDEAQQLEDDGFAGEDAEVKPNVILVQWDGGDDDPMNPRRFGYFKKWAVVWINSFSALCVTVASSIYITTYDQQNAEFHNSREVGTVGLSLFVFGLATGPLILAPLSEFYGRRSVYLVSYAMYIIWLIPSAVAKNIQTMLVARFLCGFSGSAFLSVSGGSVGDMFNRDELQAPMMWVSRLLSKPF